MKTLGDLRALITHAETLGWSDSTPLFVLCHSGDCPNDSERVPCTRLALTEDAVHVDIHGDAVEVNPYGT